MKKNVFLLGCLSLLSIACLAGCNKGLSYSHEFKEYTVGTTTNSEVHDYDNIVVNGPTNALNEDFAYGVDCSVVHEVESLGGRYYNEEGKEEDIFKILANDGVNYVRFRLWVDPWSASGDSYGGGTNDTYTDIYMAKRAIAAGLKVMVDFHYSDSWADPSKQWRPKAWSKLTYSELPTKCKEYTSSTLQDFKDAGVTVSSVQIGNETNNKICGIPSSQTTLTAQFLEAGIEGAKSVFPDVKTIIHLTNIKSEDGITKYFNNLITNKVDFDVAGFSYYPYWHGTKANLQKVLDDVAALTSKPVMICETAWGFTDETSEYASNQYSTDTFGLSGGYVTSAQGQITEVADLVDVLSKVPNKQGIGLFYWEPDWLPVSGSHWINPAGAYYNDKGTDGTDSKYTESYCLQSWANQAWFSYSGKVLPSASVYKHIKSLDKTASEQVSGLISNELTATLNLADSEDSLPTTIQGYSNVGAYRDLDIVWNETEVAAMKAAGDGNYDIDGVAGGKFNCVVHVSAISNFVSDPSFEKQGNDAESALKSPWTVSYTGSTAPHIETKSEGNRTGTHYFHWYDTEAFTWTLSQDISNVRSGVYKLNTYIMTNDKDSDGKYTKMDLWIKVGNGEKQSISCLDKCKGWQSSLKTGMLECALADISIPTDYSSVTIGMDCAGGATSWGHNDDWALVKTGSLA